MMELEEIGQRDDDEGGTLRRKLLDTLMYGSVKEIFPDYTHDDTEFIRLLFSALPVYFDLVRRGAFSEGRPMAFSIFAVQKKGEPEPIVPPEPILEWRFSSENDALRILLSCFYEYFAGARIGAEYERLIVMFSGNSAENGCVYGIIKNGTHDPGDAESLFPDKAPKNDGWKDLGERISGELFVPSSVKGELKKVFDKLSRSAEKIVGEMFVAPKKDSNIRYFGKYIKVKISKRFPSLEQIENYNSSYYDLAELCFKESGLFTQSANAKKFIGEILSFGMEEKRANTRTKRNTQESFWLLSPYALHSLRNVYERARNLAREFFEAFPTSTDMLCRLVQHDFIESSLADFKHWVFENDTNSLVAFDGDHNVLKKYHCRDLSSIETIRAVRIYEKIMEYINSYVKWLGPRANSDKKIGINICIVGYVKKSIRDAEFGYPELIYLRDFVKRTLDAGELKDKVSVKYTLIMSDKKWKTPREEVTYQNFTVQFEDYDKLFLSNELEELINKYNLLFFVDNPQLYDDEPTLDYSSSWESMRHTLSATSYHNNYHDAGCDRAIGSRGILTNIYEQLCVMSNRYTKGYSSFSQTINNSLLDKICEIVASKKNETPKTVYCFLETIESKTSSRYKNSPNVHLETYNYKDFYVVRTHNKDSYAPKDEAGDEKAVYFSLWSIIKNGAIRLCGPIYKLLCKKLTGIEILSDLPHFVLNSVVIRLSWKKGHYTVEWGLSSRCFAGAKSQSNIDIEEINRFIAEFFVIVLGIDDTAAIECVPGVKGVEDIKLKMWYHSVKESFCNVILGRASNGNALLNYYRVKRGLAGVRSLSCSYIDDPNTVEGIFEKNKMSTFYKKKLYYNAMVAFDQFAVNPLKRVAVIRQIVQNNSDPDDIFRNIMEACEGEDYIGTNLYQNIRGF